MKSPKNAKTARNTASAKDVYILAEGEIKNDQTVFVTVIGTY
jgi:hypothetical protein